MTPQEAARILVPLLREDEALRDAITLICSKTGCNGIGELGLNHPEMLVALAETWPTAMDYQPVFGPDEDDDVQLR